MDDIEKVIVDTYEVVCDVCGAPRVIKQVRAQDERSTTYMMIGRRCFHCHTTEYTIKGDIK